MSTPDPVREMLAAHLRAQRAHITGAIEGLDPAVLRRAVLPSGWSAIGLVQHLALDVERFWFRSVVAGEDVHLPTLDEGWTVADDVPVESVLELYADECARADAIIAERPLDADPAWWPDFFGDLPRRTLMRTVMHVVTETATHAGHLDAWRELVDGSTWLVLTD